MRDRKTLDKLEDRPPGRLSIRPRVTVDQLSFESGYEALGHRVVVATPSPPQGGQNPRLFEAATELHRGVLAAPVGVMDQSRRWTASVDRHVHRVEDQLRPEVVRHGPAYDLSGVGVEHEGEVEPPLPGPDVGDVRYPQAVRSFGSEVALHQLRSRGSTF